MEIAREERLSKIVSGFAVGESEGMRAVRDFVQGKKGEEKKVSEDSGESPKEDEFMEDPEIEKTILQLEESPELSYDEKLAKVGVTKDEAALIVDDLLEKGYFEKRYSVTKKHDVVFRTRSENHFEDMLMAIELDKPQYPLMLSNIMSKKNLIASMVEFRGVDYRKRDAESKKAFIEKMPDALYRLLVGKLNKFDQMIQAVMDDGAIQNF